MSLCKLRPAVFLDRDGTLNIEKDYLYRFDEWEWIDGSVEAIKMLNKNGFLTIVVSNQAGIARDKYKAEDVELLHSLVEIDLQKKGALIDDFYYCPYHPDGVVKKYKKKSLYRKPGNLMIKKLKKKWNIDMKKSFMIGDKKSDKLAALKSGLYFEYAKKNFYRQVKKIDEKVSNNYL